MENQVSTNSTDLEMLCSLKALQVNTESHSLFGKKLVQ
jgi:hypothetical protein